jgi:hypothetical protein
MFMPLGRYDSEMTLILFVGLDEDGLTAGASTSRGKPLPLPLIVGSTQSPTGTAGPVYGYVVSTSRGLTFAGTTAAPAVDSRAPNRAERVAVFMLAFVWSVPQTSCVVARVQGNMQDLCLFHSIFATKPMALLAARIRYPLQNDLPI